MNFPAASFLLSAESFSVKGEHNFLSQSQLQPHRFPMFLEIVDCWMYPFAFGSFISFRQCWSSQVSCINDIDLGHFLNIPLRRAL